MKKFPVILVLFLMTSCTGFTDTDYSCTWRNQSVENCQDLKEVSFPRPLEEGDLDQFKGIFPVVRIGYNMKGMNNPMQVLYILSPSDETQCSPNGSCVNNDAIASGGIITIDDEKVVLTVQHLIPDYVDIPHSPQDTLLLWDFFEFTNGCEQMPINEVSDITSQELKGKTAQLFFYVQGQPFKMDLKIDVFTYNVDRLGAVVPSDLGDYFGGISGAPLFYKGKIVGIFSGFVMGVHTSFGIYKNRYLVLANFSPPEAVREVIKEFQKNRRRIIFK